MAEHQLRRSPQPTPQPNHRQSVRDGMLSPKLLNGTPVSIHLHVADATPLSIAPSRRAPR